MLHHVAVEVPPEKMGAEGEFWQAVGFQPVTAPAALGSGYAWYEREGTQIHLMAKTDPAEPPASGHVAVVAPDIDLAMERLRGLGIEVREGRPLWGERRAKAVTPAGHLVELMVAPPAAATEEL